MAVETIEMKDGGLLIKNKAELFDVFPYLPDTNINELVLSQIDNYVETDYDDNDRISKRIGGMVKWFLSSTYKGNRNTNLFRLGYFIYDVSGDKERALYEVRKANSMLAEPIKDKELENTVIRSLERRL